MLRFKTFMHLDEETEKSVSNNTKGVMHELLTGYHLNGGKHMTHHEDSNGDSPEEAHNKLKATMHPDDYKKAHDRAKSAAEDIKKKLPAGHNIHQVHWTSKPEDIYRSTGIHSSQKEDSSDLMIHTKKSSSDKPTYHGVSLKVSDNASKNLPASSLGIKSSGSKAEEIHEKHKSDIRKAHPLLVGKNKVARKAILASNPKMKADIKERNLKTLHAVAKAHADELNHKLTSGNHAEVVKHIREVLHAHKTPLQKAGHNFVKHTTYETAKGVQHHTNNPGEEHEHILNDHKNITVKSSGSAVHYYHNGKKFASQAHKFDSQSDPLSNLKSAGKAA
jgi:hypothetical protein